jgi:hypothetical protein
MYNFIDKYVCLVLTCNKSPYKEKLISNQHIYQQIKHAGFEVCFLYADPTLTEARIILNEDETYNLTIPTEEEYTNLAVKMHLAYCFFNSQSIRGILKIDDDVYYIDDECLDSDYYRCDYLGIHMIKLEVLNRNEYRQYRKEKFKDTNINYTEDDISVNNYFFQGPFYWISKKALNYISDSKWDPQIFGGSEDAFVGLTLANISNIKSTYKLWKILNYIKYDE